MKKVCKTLLLASVMCAFSTYGSDNARNYVGYRDVNGTVKKFRVTQKTRNRYLNGNWKVCWDNDAGGEYDVFSVCSISESRGDFINKIANIVGAGCIMGRDCCEGMESGDCELKDLMEDGKAIIDSVSDNELPRNDIGTIVQAITKYLRSADESSAYLCGVLSGILVGQIMATRMVKRGLVEGVLGGIIENVYVIMGNCEGVMWGCGAELVRHAVKACWDKEVVYRTLYGKEANDRGMLCVCINRGRWEMGFGLYEEGLFYVSRNKGGKRDNIGVAMINGNGFVMCRMGEKDGKGTVVRSCVACVGEVDRKEYRVYAGQVCKDIMLELWSKGIKNVCVRINKAYGDVWREVVNEGVSISRSGWLKMQENVNRRCDIEQRKYLGHTLYGPISDFTLCYKSIKTEDSGRVFADFEEIEPRLSMGVSGRKKDVRNECSEKNDEEKGEGNNTGWNDKSFSGGKKRVRDNEEFEVEVDGQSEIDRADAAMWEEEEEFVVEVDNESEIERADAVMWEEEEEFVVEVDNESEIERADDTMKENEEEFVAGERGKTKDIKKMKRNMDKTTSQQKTAREKTSVNESLDVRKKRNSMRMMKDQIMKRKKRSGARKRDREEKRLKKDIGVSKTTEDNKNRIKRMGSMQGMEKQSVETHKGQKPNDKNHERKKIECEPEVPVVIERV